MLPFDAEVIHQPLTLPPSPATTGTSAASSGKVCCMTQVSGSFAITTLVSFGPTNQEKHCNRVVSISKSLTTLQLAQDY